LASGGSNVKLAARSAANVQRAVRWALVTFDIFAQVSYE